MIPLTLFHDPYGNPVWINLKFVFAVSPRQRPPLQLKAVTTFPDGPSCMSAFLNTASRFVDPATQISYTVADYNTGQELTIKYYTTLARRDQHLTLTIP